MLFRTSLSTGTAKGTLKEQRILVQLLPTQQPGMGVGVGVGRGSVHKAITNPLPLLGTHYSLSMLV